MMSLRVTSTRVNAFPSLGWVAEISFPRREIRVLHGAGVEVGDDFVVEGCWPGDFGALDYHRSECFFGSGLRVIDDAVFVVPSCALTDRVFLAYGPRSTLASNSLVLILCATDCLLDAKVDYRPVCHSILAGVDSYDRRVPTTCPDISLQQIYHRPEIITAAGSLVAPRADARRFRSFSDYEDNLLDALTSIQENCMSQFRSRELTAWSTASTGYDSTAVSALARQCGVSTAYVTCGDVSHKGVVLEDSREIARALGMNARTLRPKIPLPELERLCLAATFDGRETAFAKMFEQAMRSHCVGCLWSGYHGDKIWDRATSGSYLGKGILRGDTSGLNLSEVRLHSGFVNLAVPFIFASSIKDIVTISNAPEMLPWQIGGDYDRPIARRIAEARGVPRNAFGQKKSVVMEYYTYPRNRQIRREFFTYLSNTGFGAVRRGLYQAALVWDYRTRSAPGLQRLSLCETLRPGAKDLGNTLFTWAANSAVERALAQNPEVWEDFRT